jgi:hypothetical protein
MKQFRFVHTFLIPCQCQSFCIAHASADRRCPVFTDKKPFRNFGVKDSLAFLDAWKRFLESNPKAGTQSPASTIRRLQGTDAATETTALLN